jgi:hypothetical protein
VNPITCTPIPATTNAERAAEEGSIGKVETTIPHPETNSRKPASFILLRPESHQKANAATECQSNRFFLSFLEEERAGECSILSTMAKTLQIL